MTSTFPRYQGDTDPPFVYELCTHIASHYSVTILAPHARGLHRRENFNSLPIYRFKYFFQFGEMLAYDGGMLNKLRQHRAAYLIIPFFLVGEIAAALRLLKSQSYALINPHWLLPQGFCALIARSISRSKTPIICTVHGGDIFALRDPLSTLLKLFVLRGSDAVIAVSRAVKDKVLRFGIDDSKVHIIPMGVDLQKLFVPSVQEQTKKKLLFVGRLVSKKGLLILIESLPEVFRHHPDATLTIVGSGPQEYVAKQRIAALNLSHKVEFLGALPHHQLPIIYQSASIVIFPSIVDPSGDTEGLGMVMIEAMGCGCAVIASDLPAVRDVVIDHTTGILVEQQNPASLAEKIIYLLENPTERRAIGKNARQFVRQRFDWSVTASSYCELIERFIK